jgi:hypothetical protein
MGEHTNFYFLSPCYFNLCTIIIIKYFNKNEKRNKWSYSSKSSSVIFIIRLFHSHWISLQMFNIVFNSIFNFKMFLTTSDYNLARLLMAMCISQSLLSDLFSLLLFAPLRSGLPLLLLGNFKGLRRTYFHFMSVLNVITKGCSESMSDFWWQFVRTWRIPLTTVSRGLHTASSCRSCKSSALHKVRPCNGRVWRGQLFQGRDWGTELTCKVRRAPTWGRGNANLWFVNKVGIVDLDLQHLMSDILARN